MTTIYVHTDDEKGIKPGMAVVEVEGDALAKELIVAAGELLDVDTHGLALIVNGMIVPNDFVFTPHNLQRVIITRRLSAA